MSFNKFSKSQSKAAPANDKPDNKSKPATAGTKSTPEPGKAHRETKPAQKS